MDVPGRGRRRGGSFGVTGPEERALFMHSAHLSGPVSQRNETDPELATTGGRGLPTLFTSATFTDTLKTPRKNKIGTPKAAVKTPKTAVFFGTAGPFLSRL